MSLEVEQVTKRFAGRAVVHDVSFSVADGELVALLGPSGSGKSTILRSIAGLVGIDHGRIRVDGEDVTDLPPQSRDLGFVFQNYALFEHLSVADNIEFALRVRKLGRVERRQRRDELLELVGLGGSAGKFPSQLSGGQRQRTALARSLAHRPKLLLLDEPFGALDARIRQELRQGLRELLKQLGTTAIFVTHDQEEAFAVADRIMVLHRGRLLEEGEPRTLYAAPKTEFVASFVGRANLLPGELTPNGVRVRLDGEPSRGDVVPKRISVLLRPEEIWLDEPRETLARGPGQFACHALVQRVEYLGATERVYLELERSETDRPGGRRHLIEALRPIEESQVLPLGEHDRVAVLAKKLHAVSHPSLRVLVLADEGPEGRALAECALGWGERQQALVTLLGGAVSDSSLRRHLEAARQSFAGDLRLVDPGAMGVGIWPAATSHLEGERYDVAMLPPSALANPERLLALFQGTNLRQAIVMGQQGDPLANGGLWSVLLGAFSSRSAPLDLLAEVAESLGASAEVRSLDEVPSTEPVRPRWHDALLLRKVPFTVANDPTEQGAGPPPIDPGVDLVALDLGRRAGLGSRQSGWLRGMQGHWTWLMVQPDESDLSLRQRAPFTGSLTLSMTTSLTAEPSNPRTSPCID